MPFVYCTVIGDEDNPHLIIITTEIVRKMASGMSGDVEENFRNIVSIITSLKKEISKGILFSQVGLTAESFRYTQKIRKKHLATVLNLTKKLQSVILEADSILYDVVEGAIYTAGEKDCYEMMQLWENMADYLKGYEEILTKSLDGMESPPVGRINKLEGFTHFVGLFAAIYEHVSQEKFTFNPHYNADDVYTEGQRFVMVAMECLYVGDFQKVPRFTDENFQSACSYAFKSMDHFRKIVNTSV